MKAKDFEVKELTKIYYPGIYPNVKLTEAKRNEHEYEFTFTTVDNTYQNSKIFAKINEEYIEKIVKANFERKSLVPSGKDFKEAVEKEKTKAETTNTQRIIEIANAVGDKDVVSEIEGKNYLDLIEAIYKYIAKLVDKGTADLVNIKVAMDWKGEWTEIPKSIGSIEKWVDGKDPKIKFSNSEIEKERNKRPAPAPSLKSNDFGFDQKVESTERTNDDMPF